MDIFLKTIGGAMIALLMTLILSGIGKDYSLLLGLLTCCMITAVAMAYMEPVISYIRQLAELIPLDNGMLGILFKITLIGTIGEIASLICNDSGNSALGKTIQLMTGILILWMALPMLQMLMDLVTEFLEGI